MESVRLPRFKRATEIPPIRLTGRDREIIRQVHRHRFLRSSHIVALIGGSSQQVSRRLQRLFHHGYLDRPRSQIITIRILIPQHQLVTQRGSLILRADIGKQLSQRHLLKRVYAHNL